MGGTERTYNVLSAYFPSIVKEYNGSDANNLPGPISHMICYGSTIHGFGTTGSIYRIGNSYPIQIGFGWDNHFHWRGSYDNGYSDWHTL